MNQHVQINFVEREVPNCGTGKLATDWKDVTNFYEFVATHLADW